MRAMEIACWGAGFITGVGVTLFILSARVLNA